MSVLRSQIGIHFGIGCHCTLSAVTQVMPIRTPPVAEVVTVAARPAAAAITSGRRLDVRAAVIAAVI